MDEDTIEAQSDLFSEDYSLGKLEAIGSLELLDGYAGED
jgi:hypothetical protein